MPADLALVDSKAVAVVSPVCSVARTVDRDVTGCFRRESSDGQVSDLGRVDSASRVYLDAWMDDPGWVLPDSDQPACLACPAYRAMDGGHRENFRDAQVSGLNNSADGSAADGSWVDDSPNCRDSRDD